jgi:hypothetical protein
MAEQKVAQKAEHLAAWLAVQKAEQRVENLVEKKGLWMAEQMAV